MPITPKSLKVTIGNKNTTIDLINQGEVNISKGAGLKEIEFDLLLPNSKYPFANYQAEYKPAQYFQNELVKLKEKGQSFQFVFVRNKNNSTNLGNNDITVVIEDLSFTDSTDEGFDIVASIKLKEWKKYGTKTFTVDTPTRRTYPTTPRYEEPEEPQTTYTVEPGDCLWAIARMFYGDGSRYWEIYEANSDQIDNPDLIYAGQVFIIP